MEMPRQPARRAPTHGRGPSVCPRLLCSMAWGSFSAQPGSARLGMQPPARPTDEAKCPNPAGFLGALLAGTMAGGSAQAPISYS